MHLQKYYPLKEQFIDEAVRRVNEMHKYANLVVPQLLEIMPDARLLKTETLDAKTKKFIKSILEPIPEKIQAFVSTAVYSVRLELKTSFPNSESGCCKYADSTYYLKDWNQDDSQESFTPRKLILAQQIRENLKDYAEMYEIANEAIEKTEQLASKCSYFFQK